MDSLFRRIRRSIETVMVALALLSCEGSVALAPEPDADVDAPVAARVVRVPARVAEAPAAAVSASQPAPRPAPPDPEAEARAARERAQEELDREWPLHGVCYHYLAHVRARPDASSAIIGYMRRGAQFRAKEAQRGPGCARGWSEVVGGGYVCRGEGYQLGEAPQTFEGSPVAPAIASTRRS